MNSLQSIRLRALALRSSIHNEHQLSAIELCGMVAKKTNELIDVINDLSDYIENVGVAVGVYYNEATESLEIKGATE